jgi:hypothetical protein
MARLTVHNNNAPQGVILDALHVAADVLGVDVCWYYCGGFHFRLTDSWTVSITPETAGRLRVETWCRLRRRDRKWARSDDRHRIAYLVREALDTAFQPA